MNILENISLKPYNTFGIDVKAKLFASVNTENELLEVLNKYEDTPKFILGGGSNMLLVNNVEQLVIHLNTKGISISKETNDSVLVQANAGETWHEFVLWCIEHNFGGVENLSLIPGNVGTSPIQNIGAYGVELKDIFYSCEAITIATGKKKIFTKEECHFGYRESIFKTSKKGKYIITKVTFKLTTKQHTLHTEYGAIQQQLESNRITSPTIKDVSEAVIAIRRSKLPDPDEIGNSGSFFKNPVVDKTTFDIFRKEHPEAPFYKVSDTEFKIPAGWLIEQSGFKGKRFGDAGVHKNQALVLVNYGNATGNEIWELALNIKDTVFKNFKINIEPEVNIV
ncbi:UDP-N-acetylenolpyruvoylglucosamine reductase [Neptunitalea chrysea]|uniref:UDP-N-acetylenolpyruvoylglucosamine reductase n=1 Tax=Neptunitalea chrysea TaxID=1647581 RepID=A0A9W6B572_9FLAO|nr:UDP-N-acetylmuramate dehydrogenase [Neptunitalea chrysea]GLB52082.1 UDP-N-acetylenolpyruvoylglucosamine reductase [Neptunitalea chrysea]